MKTHNNDFINFAAKDRGLSSMHVESYIHSTITNYTPYIIEERPLNISQLDVFSRLMMDRIIFLGTPIDDHIANIIQAQLLFLTSNDPNRDIQIYINSPGGMVYWIETL